MSNDRLKFRAWLASPGGKGSMQDHGTVAWAMQDFLDDKDATIMQWTGLYDCEGREIYEGDIVRIPELYIRWKHGEPDVDWRVLVVEWNRYLWSVNNSVLYMPLSDYDVTYGQDYTFNILGNIHENPELIENG